MTSIAELSDEQVLKAAQQLRVAYGLKRTLRYDTKRDLDVHSESVAEHVFGLMFLAQYFLQCEEVGPSLNVEKLYRILLFHDFGEIKHGDVPYHRKTEEHEVQERVAAEELFNTLPPFLQQVGYESWRDYEERMSPEARFAYALDKIEPLFELLDPVNERSMKRLEFSYQMHIEKKLKATAEFPAMRRFVEVISKDMLDRNIFWDGK